jgi:hypothetical protein
MMIQWCLKGINFRHDASARKIIDERMGIRCSWWLDVGSISPQEISEKLTPDNIDMHVNQFITLDPATNRPFCEVTPFISLTAGTVERDYVMKTNRARRALPKALQFGSNSFR